MTRDELIAKYCSDLKLPTKTEWIETRGGEHGQYLSYETRWFVEEAFKVGWDVRDKEVSHLRATMAVTVQTLKSMLKKGSFSVYGESVAESEIEHIERALALKATR